MALLDLLLEFKAQGIACILISHKLNEISRVADSITVLRDGATVQSLDCRADEVSEDQIIRAMVGRELADRYPPRARLAPEAGETVFEVRDWHVAHPAARRPRSRQGRRPEGQARRDRRHRGPDGRRAAPSSR